MESMFYNNDTYVVTVTCVDNNFDSSEARIALAWCQLVVIFLLPVVTIVYCYAFVISVLWLSTKRLARLTQTDRCVLGGYEKRSRPRMSEIISGILLV